MQVREFSPMKKYLRTCNSLLARNGRWAPRRLNALMHSFMGKPALVYIGSLHRCLLVGARRVRTSFVTGKVNEGELAVQPAGLPLPQDDLEHCMIPGVLGGRCRPGCSHTVAMLNELEDLVNGVHLPLHKADSLYLLPGIFQYTKYHLDIEQVKHLPAVYFKKARGHN
ncbi:hypothetical protein MRX96_030013 [Rhipicephalus microplus]